MEDHKEANILENKLSVGAFYHYSAAFWGEDIYVEGIVVYNDGATAVIRVTDRYEECEFDVLYYKEIKQILPFFNDPEAKNLTEYLCMDVETEVCLFSRDPDDSTIMYRTIDEDGIRNLVPADFKKVRIERFSKMVGCELKIREDAEKTYGLGYGLSEGELYHHPVSEETYVEGIVLLNDGYTAVIRVTDRYSECFFEILYYNEVKQMFPFFIDPFYDPEAKRLPEYLCLDVETESNLFFRDPDDDTIMHWVTDENGNWSLVPADFIKVRMEQFKKAFLHEVTKSDVEPPPTCPAVLMDDPRLEDAFKQPEEDENGYSSPIPAIWYATLPEIEDNEILYITSAHAGVVSNLYSKYLDEEAIIWDAGREKLFFYKPDPKQPRLAFKSGMGMWFAKKLKPESANLSLKDIYIQMRSAIKT